MEINYHLHNCRWHATPATLEGKGTWVALGDYKLRFCFPDIQYPLLTELNLSVHSPGLVCRKVSSANPFTYCSEISRRKRCANNNWFPVTHASSDGIPAPVYSFGLVTATWEGAGLKRLLNCSVPDRLLL